MDLNGDFNEFRDQESELSKTMYRLAMAENIITDKKLQLFQDSRASYEDRFKEVDFEAGQFVMIRRHDDERPMGVLRKEWLPYTGPHLILEVRDYTLLIDKDGKNDTVNKTKTIVVQPPTVPVRDLRGRRTDAPIEDKAEQEALWRKKLDHIRGKTRVVVDDDGKLISRNAREALTMGDVAKLRRRRPELKRLYSHDELLRRKGQMALVWVNSKKGTYLARLLDVNRVGEDPKHWVEVHLYGADSNPQATQRKPTKLDAKTQKQPAEVKTENRLRDKFIPWWVIPRNWALREKQPGYTECWEQVYVEDVIYVCQEPLTAERGLHAADLEEIEKLWAQDGVFLMLTRVLTDLLYTG